jgi:hypothetical protein
MTKKINHEKIIRENNFLVLDSYLNDYGQRIVVYSTRGGERE